MEGVRAVAAIIERDGRVFCAHRTTSQCGPGWEFPGGHIEPGETPEEALRREIDEELGVRLSTLWLFDTVEHDYPTFHLSMDCFVCELAPGAEPELREHDEARWLGRDELLSVGWLPADQRIVAQLGMSWDAMFASEHL